MYGRRGGNAKTPAVSMSQYNNKNGSCFAAECYVKLMNGKKVEVSTLRNGIKVWTAKGGRKVAAVVAMR
jgi:Hint-domain